MSATLTMRQAAEAVGLSYEHFRKVWPQMCAGQGFPAPYLHARRPRWIAAAVAGWMIERTQRPIAAAGRRQALPQPPPRRGAIARLRAS